MTTYSMTHNGLEKGQHRRQLAPRRGGRTLARTLARTRHVGRRRAS